VTAASLPAHATGLERHGARAVKKLCFTYAAVINTVTSPIPAAEPPQGSAESLLAFVRHRQCGIDRGPAERCGLFDTGFPVYGWEVPGTGHQ